MNTRFTYWLTLLVALWLSVYTLAAGNLFACSDVHGTTTTANSCCDGSMECPQPQSSCPSGVSCNLVCSLSMVSVVPADILLSTPSPASEYYLNEEQLSQSFIPDVPQPPPRLL